MFHPVNGRRGFDALPPPTHIKDIPPIELMTAILKREDQLRLSPEVQGKFADPSFDTIHVAAEVQEQVAREFGFPDIAVAVEMIRAAPALYPNNPEIRKIPHYLKFNRSCQGALQCGDTVPDAYLAKLTGAPVGLYEFIESLENKSKPLVVNAGSYS